MSETKSTLDVIACKYLRRVFNLFRCFQCSLIGQRKYDTLIGRLKTNKSIDCRSDWVEVHSMFGLCKQFVPTGPKWKGWFYDSKVMTHKLWVISVTNWNDKWTPLARMQKRKQHLVEKVQFQLLHPTIKLIGPPVGIISFKDAQFLSIQNLKWL